MPLIPPGVSPANCRLIHDMVGAYSFVGMVGLGLMGDDNAASHGVTAGRAGVLPDWFKWVRKDGKWDYKHSKGEQYEDFGNFNYGATGGALGFSLDDLLRAAGCAQIMTNPDHYDKRNGVPWGPAPYGDWPEDQDWIRRGYDWWKENRKNLPN